MKCQKSQVGFYEFFYEYGDLLLLHMRNRTHHIDKAFRQCEYSYDLFYEAETDRKAELA